MADANNYYGACDRLGCGDAISNNNSNTTATTTSKHQSSSQQSPHREEEEIEPQQQQQQQQQQPPVDQLAALMTTAPLQPSRQIPLVWRKPWMMALVLFFFFYILWAYGVVIKRYWINEKWDAALPGLGASYPRKLSMRSHMTFGAIAILCSPIQLLNPNTNGWRRIQTNNNTRNWYRRIHRYSGRIYVLCAILSFIFGQWFICLKKFMLVGGYNMGASFSFAGFCIAYFAYMTWKTAPTKNNDNHHNENNHNRYTIEDHRNYAIRSFSQIIAPVLYRYWYSLLILLKMYRTPYMYNTNDGKNDLVCDDRNVCHDFLRPFDAVYCWLYWISSWIVAEIIIACLPKHQQQQKQTHTMISSSGESGTGDDAEVPLLENSSSLSSTTDANRQQQQQQQHTGTSNKDDKNGSNPQEGNHTTTIDENGSSVHLLIVNCVGCLVASSTVPITCVIMYLIVSSVINKSKSEEV